MMFAAGVVLLLGGVACGGNSQYARAQPSSGGDLALYERPIESTDAERGSRLFEDFCGECHPEGDSDEGPSLIAEPHTPGEIRKVVREGRRTMERYSEQRMSDADLESVLAWMASVGAVR